MTWRGGTSIGVRCPDAPVALRHLQVIRLRSSTRGSGSRDSSRRSARHSRRERRRQVHAAPHRGRVAAPRGGHDFGGRRPTPIPFPARCPTPWHRDGAPACHRGAGVFGDGEHRARRRLAGDAGGTSPPHCRVDRPPRPPSRPPAARRRALRRAQTAPRNREGAGVGCPSPPARRADRRAGAGGGHGAVPLRAGIRAIGRCGGRDYPQARRSAGRCRPDHGAAAGEGDPRSACAAR